MSSYVISKEEYIKAAGVVAGIVDKLNAGSLDRFWLYDYITRRNMTADDYYRNFAECFEMNALSVQEQYHDDTPERDDNEYFDTFSEYRAKAKRNAGKPDKLREMVLMLHSFFKSAEYQTEKESYYWKMTTFFNRINSALLPFMTDQICETWGAIEL